MKVLLTLWLFCYHFSKVFFCLWKMKNFSLTIHSSLRLKVTQPFSNLLLGLNIKIFKEVDLLVIFHIYQIKIFQLVMDPGQKVLTWVGLGQPSMVWVWKISPKNVKFFSPWVSHLWFGFGKSPLKIPNFQFFPFGSKKILFGSGQPLIYCGSKVCSGRDWSGLISNYNYQRFMLKSFRILARLV